MERDIVLKEFGIVSKDCKDYEEDIEIKMFISPYFFVKFNYSFEKLNMN